MARALVSVVGSVTPAVEEQLNLRAVELLPDCPQYAPQLVARVFADCGLTPDAPVREAEEPAPRAASEPKTRGSDPSETLGTDGVHREHKLSETSSRMTPPTPVRQHHSSQPLTLL